jgi:hypothetical protein
MSYSTSTTPQKNSTKNYNYRSIDCLNETNQYAHLTQNYFSFSPSNALGNLAINSPILAKNNFYCNACDTFDSSHLCPYTKNYISTSTQCKRKLNSVNITVVNYLI